MADPRDSTGLTVEDVIARVPGWAAAASLRSAPLHGGITNENHRVDIDGEPFVVRIGGRGTEWLGIDRAHELAAARMAAGLGIGPEVVWASPEAAVLVTRFVEGRVLTPDDLRVPATLDRVAAAVRRVHAGPAIPGVFSACRTVEAYRVVARRHGVGLPAGLDDWLALACGIEAGRPPGAAVPCHNDLLAANLIDDGTRIRILDWEYAGMGDPFFDLGNLAANAELGADEERRLLVAYGAEPSAPVLARLRRTRLVSDLREAMWGLVQVGVSRLAFDFAGYAARHLARVAERAGALTWR